MAVRYTTNQFTKNLVKRQKLVTHLDKALEEEPIGFEYRYEGKEEDDAWHPSSHCTPSVTALYDIATGQGDKQKFSVKNGQVGHFWHQLLQFYILKLGFAEPNAIEHRGSHWWGDPVPPTNNHGFPNIDPYFRAEDLFYLRYEEQKGADPVLPNYLIKLLPRIPGKEYLRARPQPYHWATGAADVAPCSIPRNGDWVVDFKTMGGHDYKQNALPAWCADKYEAQINIYMDMFDLEQGLIVAIEKDSPHNMKEFVFERNQPLIDTIYNKWEFISELLEHKEQPGDLDDTQFKLPLEGPVE